MSIRVLIVDDDAASRKVLSRLLAMEGYAVEACDGAESALVRLRAGPYDVLLTDLIMPGASGLELIAAAKLLQHDLRCFVTTGQPRTREAAADTVWLAKPLDVDGLLAQLPGASLVGVSGERLPRRVRDTMPRSMTAPRLHHASSSYFSMVARLALIEAAKPYTSIELDIHRRKEQLAPAYVRLNPHMTVPTLELPGRVLDESRDILAYAFGDEPPEAKAWLDVHYAFPMEELTFGWLLSWNPLLRRAIPRQMAGTARHLRELAAAHPDLADPYQARAEVFSTRARTFDPARVASLFDERVVAARALLARLDGALGDGRAFFVGDAYGPVDVVFTVFLARLGFIRRAHEVDRFPALARYRAAMFARPSFGPADLWTSLRIWQLVRQAL